MSSPENGGNVIPHSTIINITAVAEVMQYL